MMLTHIKIRAHFNKNTFQKKRYFVSKENVILDNGNQDERKKVHVRWINI